MLEIVQKASTVGRRKGRRSFGVDSDERDGHNTSAIGASHLRAFNPRNTLSSPAVFSPMKLISRIEADVLTSIDASCVPVLYMHRSLVVFFDE